MAEKVTKMVIRVDLGCGKCRKKIKKVLCKIPQIQNQIYDEKSNTVTITVVCCSPEKVKDKICCKAGDTILGIQIIAPQPPAKAPEKPTEKKKEEEKEPPPRSTKSDGQTDDSEPSKPKHPDQAKAPEKTKSVPGFLLPAYPQPIPCHGWGPCHLAPCMPPPCYDPCYGRPVYDNWGGSCSRMYVSRCSDYVSEDNPAAACIIM